MIYIILLHFTVNHKYITYTSYLSLYITLSVADLLLFKYAEVSIHVFLHYPALFYRETQIYKVH